MISLKFQMTALLLKRNKINFLNTLFLTWAKPSPHTFGETTQLDNKVVARALKSIKFLDHLIVSQRPSLIPN